MEKEPIIIVQDILRNQLYDYNISRTGEWIYPDFPNVNLGNPSYPRVSVTDSDEPAKRISVGTKDEMQTIDIDINVWVKSGIIYERNSEQFEGAKLRDAIARDVVEVLRQNQDQLAALGLHNYERLGMKTINSEVAEGVLRKQITVRFSRPVTD
jgi:hypothetical protein